MFSIVQIGSVLKFLGMFAPDVSSVANIFITHPSFYGFPFPHFVRLRGASRPPARTNAVARKGMYDGAQ